MTTDTEADIPVLKERQNPVQAYRLTMTIANPPGAFAVVEGSAQYDVTNHNACGEINHAAGTISRINTLPPIQWEKRSETEYVATVYADRMIDEDYYGRGICHWAFTAASAMMRATGDESETRFLPAIRAEEIAAGQTVTWYFPKLRYPVSGIPDFAEFGHQDPEKFRPEIRDQLFTITLTAKAVQP